MANASKLIRNSEGNNRKRITYNKFDTWSIAVNDAIIDLVIN